MSNHKKRFRNWQKQLPNNTKYLVDLILLKIVPVFEQQGFVWYSDFAGGDTKQVAACEISLQKREQDDLWPTVQIWFDKRKKPFCHVYFSLLQKKCYRKTKSGKINIDRSDATVFEGGTYFTLCKGKKRNFDCQFGSNSFILQRKKIELDINILQDLLPELFNFFMNGEEEGWQEVRSGYVTKHFFKN